MEEQGVKKNHPCLPWSIHMRGGKGSGKAEIDFFIHSIEPEGFEQSRCLQAELIGKMEPGILL